MRIFQLFDDQAQTCSVPFYSAVEITWAECKYSLWPPVYCLSRHYLMIMKKQLLINIFVSLSCYIPLGMGRQTVNLTMGIYCKDMGYTRPAKNHHGAARQRFPLGPPHTSNLNLI